MKQSWIAVALVSALSAFLMAQQAPPSARDSSQPIASTATTTTEQSVHARMQSGKHPAGTEVTKRQINTEVQPVTKNVGVTPTMIRAALGKLNDKGYKAGTPTGRLNAKTRRAIGKFQRNEKLKVTARLDEN